MIMKNPSDKAMNDETEVLSEADEIAALLPWYVSGKISAADKARVDTHAKAHPEVLNHIALARDEPQSTSSTASPGSISAACVLRGASRFAKFSQIVSLVT